MWNMPYNNYKKHDKLLQRKDMDRQIKHESFVLSVKVFTSEPRKTYKKRVTLHKEQIKHEEYRNLTVSKYLHKCNDSNFNIMPVYHCESSNRLLRETKEKHFITILKPNLNME